MMRLILMPIAIGIWGLFLPLGVAGQSSVNSDYYEVTKQIYTLYDHSKKELKSQLFEIDRLLARLDEDMLKRFRQEIISFLTAGCYEEHYDEYCMFLTQNEQLRESLFKLLEKYHCHPNVQLIPHILACIQQVDSYIFKNENFVKFSQRYLVNLGDSPQRQQIQDEIIDGLTQYPYQQIKDYFRLMGYGVELFGPQTILPHFKNKYLLSTIEVHTIQKIWNEIKSLPRHIFHDVRSVILPELSRYIFQLPVKKWIEIGNDLVVDFIPYGRFPNSNYIDKVIKDMKSHWDRSQQIDTQEIQLLMDLLENEDELVYREVYNKLAPYFRNNVGRFLYLHGAGRQIKYHSPDLISFLNKDKENLQQSIRILTGLCQNHKEWPLELYKIVKTKYYNESPDQIYTQLFRPLYRDSGNHNPVRQLFLWDIYRIRFLEKKHQLEVARHFLKKDYKAVVILRPYNYDASENIQQLKNLQFVTGIYLNYYQTHYHGESDTLIYLNEILPELTGKIAGYLLENFHDYELIFSELKKILEQIEMIHRNFPGIQYREMRALIEIYNKIKQEFRLTLNAKDLSQKDKRSRLVQLIGLTIRIAGVLGDREELKYIVRILRIEIFGVSHNKDNSEGIKRMILPENQLNERKEVFISLESDLRTAAFVVKNNKDFLAALYSEFYIPLIQIQGFLDKVYEYDSLSSSIIKERPYESLFKELRQADKNTSFKELLFLLNHAGNLNIEVSLKKLLTNHYQELAINLWQEPGQYSFNENCNLWIFYHLLERMMETYHLRQDYQYQVLLEKILDQLDLAMALKGKLPKEIHDFFRFLVFRVLNSYELKTFPLYSERGKIGLSQLIGGTDKMITVGEIKNRMPIDGSYRYQLIQLMHRYLNSKDLMDLKLLVDTALMLPNSSGNNLGEGLLLSKYLDVKKKRFQEMAQQLSTQSQINMDFVILLMKLERSCRGEDLGFNRIYQDIEKRLSIPDKASLAIEKVRLDLFEQGADTLKGFENSLHHLEILILRLREIYKIGPFDPLAYALKKMFQARGGELKRAINMHELEQMYFIMAYFKNALASANKNATHKKHFLSVLKAYKDVIEVYNHFLPFMYDLDLDFMKKKENQQDILFMMLFDHDIKSALIDIREKAKKNLSEEDFLDIRQAYEKIVPYLLTHNFAGIEMVFKDADIEGLKIFNFDRTIYYQLFHFGFLYQVLETKKLNAKTFIDEAFAGFSVNLALLADVNDPVIWEYYFGDFRHRLFGNKTLSGSKLEIKCVDDAIRKMVNLSLKDQLPEKIRKPIDLVINDPVGVFTGGFVLIETATGMQKMWEGIVTKLASPGLDRSLPFYEKYQEFYRNAVFDTGTSTFRPDICKRFIQKFTLERSLPEQRQAFFPILDNLNKAITAHQNNPGFIYFQIHQQAVINLIRSVALGIKLEPGVPYIAIDIYDNQEGEEGDIKAVSEEVWQQPTLFDLYDWIYDGKRRYQPAPLIKQLFLGPKSLHAYFVESVHKYVEEKERVYVNQLKELNISTKKHLLSSKSIFKSLNTFQMNTEVNILNTYGLLVDLRKGHNRRVKERTKQKIKNLKATVNEKEDIKDFYYKLQVNESEIEKYAKEWKYILCALIPFSKYLGPSKLSLDSVSDLLNDRDIFKFYFFYFYRIYNNCNATLAKYRSSYPHGQSAPVEKFFSSGLGFEYFKGNVGKGIPVEYLGNKFIFRQLRKSQLQQKYIMVRKFQAHCAFNGTDQKSFIGFYHNKMKIFYEVLNEIDRVVNHPKRYLQLLYYVTHTFPYVTAFKLESSNGQLKFVDKYPGDITSSNEPSPFKRLCQTWNRLPQKYEKSIDILDALLKSIVLVQIERIDIHGKQYKNTTTGCLDFYNKYAGICHRLNVRGSKN